MDDPTELIALHRTELQLLRPLQHKPTQEDKERWAHQCLTNLENVHQFVSNHGWPGAAQYGEEVENAAFLMAQHGDANMLLDLSENPQIVEMQQDILSAMEAGNAQSGYVAFLTDRICRNQGEPQFYGTQLMHPDIENYETHIQAPENLNTRRDAMGLGETHEAYLERLENGDTIPFRPLIAENHALLAVFEYENIQKTAEKAPLTQLCEPCEVDSIVPTATSQQHGTSQHKTR